MNHLIHKMSENCDKKSQKPKDNQFNVIETEKNSKYSHLKKLKKSRCGTLFP